MFLVHNERIKLTATWLNTLATALVAAGVFAPVAAALYGISILAVERRYMAAVVLGCMSLGVAIHFAARRVLGRIRE